jgi:hypothetical protein
LHGRLITRGEGRGVVWGRVNFKGVHHRPAYFKLVFVDGVVEDGLSHTMVTRGKAYELKPEGQRQPARVKVPAAEPVQVL